MAAFWPTCATVLVIDNAGRRDEACVGDLTALEVRLAGLAGMLVWGCHRDGPEIAAIDLPDPIPPPAAP